MESQKLLRGREPDDRIREKAPGIEAAHPRGLEIRRVAEGRAHRKRKCEAS